MATAGSAVPDRSFNDAVLRCGVAPYGFVRAQIWRELAVAAGRFPIEPKP